MPAEEIYVSVDIEADGPVPGLYSMLSLGSAAFTSNGDIRGTFETNLQRLPGAKTDPNTMSWWEKNPEAWVAACENPRAPEEVIPLYAQWLRELRGKPVFVGYPAAYDFMFVYYYLIRFEGSSPFGHSALDIKTLTMAVLGRPFRESTKRNMPKRWFSEARHTHNALEDAIEQGRLFCNILKEVRDDRQA